MSARARRLRIGPATGDLLIRTRRAGLAATVGHDLTIVATQWAGEVTTGDDPETTELSVDVDLASLAVRDGAGGASPLSDHDRSQIHDTMRRILTPSGAAVARFEARAVATTAGGGSIDGTLSLHGVTQPVRLAVTRTGTDGYQGTATVRQSAYGIKPYSAMLGALKLRDEVQIDVDVRLDAAETVRPETLT